jgi:hypothetical protein
MGSGKIKWLILVLVATCFGCASAPALTVVHEPGLDTARERMFGLYQGDTKLASLSVPEGATLAGAAAAGIDTEARLTRLEEATDKTLGHIERLVDIVKEVQDAKSKPPTVSGPVAGAPSEPAVTVSPVTNWPDGCVLELWVAENCGPCEDIIINQLPRLPSGVATVKRIALMEEEAQSKSVPGGPYFIIYKPGGEVLIRVQGHRTADELATTANEWLAKRVSSAPSTQPGAFVATSLTPDTIPETWPAIVPINGTRTPPKSTLIWHLTGGGSGGSNHVNSFHSGWDYVSMTPGQLATLHDSDHGRGPLAMGQPRQVQTQTVQWVSQPRRTSVKTRSRACRNCL